MPARHQLGSSDSSILGSAPFQSSPQCSSSGDPRGSGAASVTVWRPVYATGTNETVARSPACASKRVRAIVYVASGMASALAGILILGYARRPISTWATHICSHRSPPSHSRRLAARRIRTYWGTLGGAALITVLTTILPHVPRRDCPDADRLRRHHLAGVAMGRVGEHLGASPPIENADAEGASHG